MTRLDATLREIEESRLRFVAIGTRDLLRQDTDIDIREARESVEADWPAHLLKQAPNCEYCEFLGPVEHDPLGTGDSPSVRTCSVTCPWGK